MKTQKPLKVSETSSIIQQKIEGTMTIEEPAYKILNTPNKEVFYIDVGEMSPELAERYLDEVKKQYIGRWTTQGVAMPAKHLDRRWAGWGSRPPSSSNFIEENHETH